MADHTPRRVSRLWVRRYGRPRAADGKYAPGTHLYTRWDGQTRWLHHAFEAVDEDNVRAAWLNAEGRRLLTHLAVLIVVAFLVVWAWPL